MQIESPETKFIIYLTLFAKLMLQVLRDRCNIRLNNFRTLFVMAQGLLSGSDLALRPKQILKLIRINPIGLYLLDIPAFAQAVLSVRFLGYDQVEAPHKEWMQHLRSH